MGAQPTSRGNHHIECPLYGKTTYPSTVVCICESIDLSIERAIRNGTFDKEAREEAIRQAETELHKYIEMEVGGRIVNEVTCPCGATYKGDSPDVFVMEHDGEHAERVIGLKPGLRDLLQYDKFDDPIQCEKGCDTCNAEDPYPRGICACDECLPLPVEDRCPVGCSACIYVEKKMIEEETAKILKSSCSCPVCLALPEDKRCEIGCKVCLDYAAPTPPEYCPNCKARYEAYELARDRKEVEEGWLDSIPVPSNPIYRSDRDFVSDQIKKRSNITVLPSMGSDSYTVNNGDTWTNTFSRSPEKND